jgi:ribosomal RNA-processing protein 12
MFSEVLIIQVKLLQSTIHEFSSIADKEVVKRIYLKTMQKLLAVTQKATKADNSRDSISMRIAESSNDSRLAFFSL